MDIESLKKMVERDMQIDDLNLDLESLKTPQLHGKYLNLLHDESLILHKNLIEQKELRRLKWEYYLGKLDQETMDEKGWQPFGLKILRTDIDVYLDSDKDLLRIEAKINYLKELGLPNCSANSPIKSSILKSVIQNRFLCASQTLSGISKSSILTWVILTNCMEIWI